MGKLQYVVVQELAASGGRKLSVGTLQISAPLEALLYTLPGWPPLTPTPIPTPPTTDPFAAPPGAVVVKAGDDLSDRVKTLRAGQVLALECGGVWAEPLSLDGSKDGVTVQPFGNGPMPQILAPFGLMLYGPLDGVTVTGIRFTGSDRTGFGVSATTKNVRAFSLLGCRVEGFMNNVVFQCPAGDATKFADYHKDLAFVNNQILDAGGTGPREGQGMYMANINGLDIHENMIDGAGRNRLTAAGGEIDDIFCHCIYGQHGNKRVAISRNILSRGESFGVQTRGPDMTRMGDDPADPGHSVTDNVIIDCAIGFAVTGTRGTASGNYVLPGHFHGPTWHHGQGAGIVHMGDGGVSNNTRLAGPQPDKSKGDWVMPFLDVGPDAPDGANPWRWTKAAAPRMQNNRDLLPTHPDLRLDLTAVIQSIRLSRSWDIGKVRDAVVRQIEALILVGTRSPNGGAPAGQ